MNLTHADIKRIRSLGTKKFRDETGLFTVEGEKLVEEALNSRFRVERIIRRDEVGETVMGRISQLSTPPPVLAIVRKEEEGPLPGRGLFLALDGIRDPGNLGTILRIADWFGVDAVLASPDTVDRYNPKVVQATMGAIFRIRFVTADLPSALRTIRQEGGKVYGTFLDGENIFSQELTNGSDAPAVLVVGNEANGISAPVAEVVSARLTIPRYGHGESLNAAVATAVAIAEFRRRQ